jgi:hypothetical protein
MWLRRLMNASPLVGGGRVMPPSLHETIKSNASKVKEEIYFRSQRFKCHDLEGILRIQEPLQPSPYGPPLMERHKDGLISFDTAATTILSHSDPLPVPLVTELVKEHMTENENKGSDQ